MKTSKIFLFAALALSAVGMQSCMDYDTPGDEFQDNQTIEPPVISSGKADVIDYQKVISDAGAKQAYKDLRSQLGSAQTAIYGLRGGKEGGMPEAHSYQYQFSLGPDNYVQYFCVPHSDFPYSNATLRSTYDMSKQFLGGPGTGFGFVKTNLASVLNAEKIDSLPELKALYLVLYNYSAIENADLFGPMPYNDHKALKETSPFTYDDVRTIYYSAEANIDSAVNCFRYYVDHRSAAYKKIVGTAISARIPLLKLQTFTSENLDVWIRFANSLKLRMAIHMTGIEPETAKKWAEEAVAGGVIEDPKDEVASYTSVYGINHPIVQIVDWGDMVMGASFVNLLQNLDHPYMKYLISKNTIGFTKTGNAEGSSAPEKTDKDSEFVGMRDGVTPGIGQAAAQNPYCGFSVPNKQYMSETMPPLYLMKLSEVCFLRAEGALRGWNMGGTAKEFYEKGIRYAGLEDRDMKGDYDKYLDEYMNVTAPKGIAYVDPTGNTPDMPSVTKIGVKWESAGGDKEKELEMIITQKYIASFPYSYESWVDLRRTGYPKLFPILGVADGDGTIQAGDSKVQSADNIMRRVPWASDDPQTKSDIEASGIPALAKDAGTSGASDTQMQRLWWDNGQSNFK